SPASLFTVSSPSDTIQPASAPADGTNLDMSFPLTSTFVSGAPSHSDKSLPSNKIMASEGGATVPSAATFPGVTTAGLGAHRSVISGVTRTSSFPLFFWAFAASAVQHITAYTTILYIFYFIIP